MNRLRHYIKTILLEEARQPLDIPLPPDLMDIHKRMKYGGRNLYLVGGAVRDALLGKTPKDYDLATEADPERVIKILQKDHTLRIDLTGKSFGVVRVKTPAGEEYEIATFRKDVGGGRRPDAVEWTGIEEDANRRDLTVNALYYDLETKEVIDFVGGIEDVQNGVIRAVGNPAERFDEDRLRILRVARFAARMGSAIDKETESAILEDNKLIDVPPERIKEEVLKAIKQAVSVQDFFAKLDQLQLMPQVFPGLSVSLGNIDDSTREPSVILAQVLIGNNPAEVERTLKSMAFSNAVVDQTEFLLNFNEITPESAASLKKAFKRLRMQPEMLNTFTDPKTTTAFTKFVSSPPAANPRDLMAQGLKGPEIGQAMQAADAELFAQLLAESFVRDTTRQILKEQENVKVLGYLKPEASFFTLLEWEEFAVQILELQKQGFDTRGGGVSLQSDLMQLVNHYFDFQINTEVNRYELLTYKNVMDFIEDFANHRLWGIEREFGHYFPDISRLRIAYFYSRGDIEPYILMDDEFTTQLYGSTWNPKPLLHYTSARGVERLSQAIATGADFDISSFTVAERPFFREDSDHIIEFVGNVRAGFRSDIKSFATTSGRRAVNLYRLEYPGHDINNICYELESCDGEVRTSLWNEYIATPIEIIGVRKL